MPTVERPLRLAEFDVVMRTALHRQERVSPTSLRWLLDADVEETARDLAAGESACSSFFAFDFSTADLGLWLEIRVPTAHVDVLDALADRAASRMRA